MPRGAHLIPPKKGEVRNPLGITGPNAGRPRAGLDYPSLIKQTATMTRAQLIAMRDDPKSVSRQIEVANARLEAQGEVRLDAHGKPMRDKSNERLLEMIMNRELGKVPDKLEVEERKFDLSGLSTEKLKKINDIISGRD